MRNALDAEAAAPAGSSPCIGVCTLDRATGWCCGCGRTIEEITAWPRLSADGARAVCARLPGRLAVMGRTHREGEQ
ncbi:DUF1289 domain-containing protein [Arhodomonas sp. SL1]|uniref:DUF1289 domain-containing protein n=1 Tax=Arhodomonas sp. SL1 TaxID=3425691 RepID=UPI003F883088